MLSSAHLRAWRAAGLFGALLAATGTAPAAALAPLRLPAVALPAPSADPALLVRPVDIPALRERRTAAPYAAYFQRFKSYVDARLTAALPDRDDDTLAKVAKGAALLEVLGNTPPGGPYPTYAAAAATALENIDARTATTVQGFGDLDPLQDSGRLQSMAEAYDLLRGGGLEAASDAAIRARIAQWAQAFADDLILPLRVNNHQIKAGAALVTAALALPGDASAAAWLSRGQQYLNDSLAKMASGTGWYREGPHYVNYSLNNLVSAAYHVRHRTGVDWFAALRPLARFAVDTRQPDGRAAPFEEGVANVFPFHVLAGAYPGDPLAAEMAWAWEHSPRDPGNYTNQQLHDATAFVVVDASLQGSPPAGSPTRFIGDDAAVTVLRSGFGADAVQATLIAAVDYDSTELISSRHNTRNPLDLVVAGAGELLLVTSSGGPEVTSSDRRDYYLRPSSRNLVLVDGNAPFVTDPSQVSVTDRLDSHAPEGSPGLCDLSTTTVRSYPGVDRVSRTLALVSGAYVVVADEVAAAQPHDVAFVWRGRGQRQPSAVSPPAAVSWTFREAGLDAAFATTAALSLAETTGWYADGWGQEEEIQGVEVRARAAHLRSLAVLAPRAAAAPAPTVVDASTPGTAALQVTRGAVTDHLMVGSGEPFAVGEVQATAAFALMRVEGGAPSGWVLTRGRSLTYGSRDLLAASGPVTLTGWTEPGRVLLVVSADQAGAPVTLVLRDIPGLDRTVRYEATLDGVPLGAARFHQTADSFVLDGVAGGRIVIAATAEPWSADGGTANDGGAGVDGGAVTDGGTSADGGAIADGGTAADGGAVTDGGVTADGGTGGSADGGGPGSGGPPSDGGAPGGAAPRGGGCQSSGARGRGSPWMGLLLAALLLGWRRRGHADVPRGRSDPGGAASRRSRQDRASVCRRASGVGVSEARRRGRC